MLRKFFSNIWVITVGGAVIATQVCAWIQNITFVDVLSNIIDLFINALTVEIKVITILILFAVITLIFNLIDKNPAPEWLKYKTDKFGDWYFTWEYGRYAGKYKVVNMIPVCKCECNLNEKYLHEWRDGYEQYGSRLYCPSCNETYRVPSEDYIREAEILIAHKIKKGTYK